MKGHHPSIRPGRKRGKELTVKASYFLLGRALQSLARVDHATRTEVAEWEEGFTVLFRVLPRGPSMALRKEDGKLRHLGGGMEKADLSINFKNIESAFMTLTPQISLFQSFAEHRCTVMGDLTRAMSVVRCISNALIHLYPRVISKRLVKRLPPASWQTWKTRLHLYCVGIPLGK